MRGYRRPHDLAGADERLRRGLGGALARPRHGRRPGRRRRRALPHLVHPPRRHPRPAGLRHPAGGDRPFARAAAALEARAAGRRLRRLEPGSSGRRSRWPTRSSPSARARATTCCACSTSPRSACTSSTTASTPTSTSPIRPTDALERYGIDPTAPYVLFVGRITRQKGIVHLVRAIQHLDPRHRRRPVRRPAGHARRSRAEMEAGVAAAQARAAGRHLDPRDGEPRARCASSTPTRRSSAARRSTSRSGSSTWRRWPATRRSWPRAVGGIPEVVVDGETGLLVPVELRQDDPMTPVDPDALRADLAAPSIALMADARTARGMGRAARRRAVERFSWRRSPTDRGPVPVA